MKFWKKIFLYSITLFLVVFNCAGIIFIEKIHSDNLNTTVKSTIDKYSSIESILYLNTDNESKAKYRSMPDFDINNFNNIKEWIMIIINGYSKSDSMGKANVELYGDDDKLIASNSNININGVRKEIKYAKTDEKSFLIRSINNKNHVFIGSIINLKNTKFKMVLSIDIDYLYIQKYNNYKYFFIIDFIVFIILASGMYIISKKLTSPIVRLSDISKDVANGNYTKRVAENKKNDEIGVLEKNFNIMLDVMEQNIEELKFTSESKQRFIDSLNHEIKTPITSILGYSELLLKGNISDSNRLKSLAYINSEAKRLETLNSTLLKLILIREEKISLQKVSFKELVMSAYNSLSYKLKESNIKIVANIDDKDMLLDKQLIVVLLSNIIDNSIKASRMNSKISVVGKYNASNDNYILKIIDCGIGISEEDLDKVLEPFYMGDKSRTRKNNGIGLGLSICNEICKTHGIIFEINSKVEIGTEVILKLNKENFIYEE